MLEPVYKRLRLDAELTEICVEIQTILANIDSLNAEIQALKEAKTAPRFRRFNSSAERKPCPSCGNPVAPAPNSVPPAALPLPRRASRTGLSLLRRAGGG